MAEATTVRQGVAMSNDVPPASGGAERAAVPSVHCGRNAAGVWRFFVEGKEFPVRGAGGAGAPGLLEALQAAGGNCVRTWHAHSLGAVFADGERFIDRAHRLGLKVVAGLWMLHERHGHDYANPQLIEEQRARLLATVRAYKNHPALLAWGLGNEMEGFTRPEGSEIVLREVEQLAVRIKAEDPHHPVLSVIAFNPAKLETIQRCCPSLDLLGINAYGPAAEVGPALKAAGWTKPYLLTEFGPRGFWEEPTTPWGAPLEPTSEEKARHYESSHHAAFVAAPGHDLCAGTFAFLWGWKQEKTATWFGLYLPTLEKLPAVDVLTRAWTGHWPEHRCPQLNAIRGLSAGARVRPGQALTAHAEVTARDDAALTFTWELVAESKAHSEGGDPEEKPASFPELITTQHAADCAFKAPSEPGPYRLFLTVRNRWSGAATANVPFLVES